MLTYKEYRGIAEFDDGAMIFHGEVIGTRDIITFQGRTVGQLTKSFRESIDDYLEFCKERNEKPDKPYSGKLNIRLSENLHRELSCAARKADKSINELIVEAIGGMLSKRA